MTTDTPPATPAALTMRQKAPNFIAAVSILAIWPVVGDFWTAMCTAIIALGAWQLLCGEAWVLHHLYVRGWKARAGGLVLTALGALLIALGPP